MQVLEQGLAATYAMKPTYACQISVDKGGQEVACMSARQHEGLISPVS